MDLNSYDRIQKECQEANATLVAVSKTKPAADIAKLREHGHLDFGENRVQELTEKAENLPDDLHWHQIGTLQTNKVKYIVPFVHLIHSVDRKKVLKEIEKQARKVDRVVPCLLQIHIAREESKFGFSEEELFDLIESGYPEQLKHVQIKGLMGMATFTDNTEQVRREFRGLRQLFVQLQREHFTDGSFDTLSMGMSGDYRIALEEGSTMVRVGSLIFGERN